MQRNSTGNGGEAGRFISNILLVEDHQDSLVLLQRLLELAGYGVQAASTVAEAFQKLENRRFDLLITDITLPDGSGLEIIQRARLNQPNLNAIAVTGFGEDQIPSRTDDAGFQAHFVKPIDIEKLKATIRRLIGPLTDRA